MNKQINPTLKPLNTNEMLYISGGSWLSYWVGYILSSIDNNVPNEDQTDYGGTYLETVSGRSSIM